MSLSALPKDHIRLLKLEGFTGQGIDKHPAFSIHVISLHAQPRYSALSYVWGVDAASHTIVLDDRPVLVGQNLYNFCFYLTREFWEYGPPDIWDYIWVDALCIDQSNLLERNQQVAMMDTIYSDAAIVIVWLGELRPDEMAMHGLSVEEREKELQRRREMPLLNGLQNSPYWARRWTVQEFILAKRVHFFCFDDLGQSRDWLGDEVLDQLPKLYLGFGRGGAHSYLTELFDRKSDGDANRATSSMLDLLLEFDECECRDPRDRVFALLSLVEANERDLLLRFFPDYSLSHESVVIITLGVLQHVRNTPVLGTYHDDGTFTDSNVLSEKYSSRWHARWPIAILSALGVETTIEDAGQWQFSVDQFDVAHATQRSDTYQPPRLLERP
ncbi:heterokaryon incompatibility protein-domain-containing protein [Xylariaceae sp. FL1019]|nr:heterokaryon incompatibility protein-domain-containing protein [Xylariaceae sp. FL1019]